MRIDSPCMRRFTLAITTVFAAMTFTAPAAQAGLVSAERHAAAATAPHNLQQQRDQVQAFLARADVQRQLVALGVDPAAADARVARMSDAEAAALAERIQALPAGAGAIEALALLFVVLIITDILGITDVFTFVRK
ncbi:MAG: PA2779 family protein [Gammaproteobacteria bacterium]